MLWEEYLGWHFHYIRCMHIRFNLVLPTDTEKTEKTETPDAPQPRDDEQQYQDYIDVAARIAEQEAEQAR